MKPFFGKEEKDEILKYLEDEVFITEFKKTKEFEGKIAEFTGAKHCIVVNNGTISLTLAAIALGIAHGDEVIVPNYTMIATPNSVAMIGAKPVFVDVEPETLVMDFDLVKKSITSNTKAIMLVSANGRTPKKGIENFEKLSKDTGIPIIEDAAQSLGSYYENGKHIGRIGKIGSFSFSSPKIISTGQGGALITDDDELAYRISRLKDFGRSSGGNDIHDCIGYNFKFTDLQACVGIAQMRQLESRISRKKEIWTLYKNKINHIKQIELFDHNLNFCSPWFIDCKVKDRDLLISYLHNYGIGTRKMYPPINNQNAYRVSGIFPVSKSIGENGLWLPSMVQITNDEIEFVINKIVDFYCN